MSLWFQPSNHSENPSETRKQGFGQIPSLRPAFQRGTEENSNMSAAAGGLVQNLSSSVSIRQNQNNTFNFDGPYFTDNSLVYQNAITNNLYQDFQTNNFMQTVQNFINIWGGGGTPYDDSAIITRLNALEAWKNSGINNASVQLMADWVVDGNDIVKDYTGLTLTYGLITALPDPADVLIPLTTCPP